MADTPRKTLRLPDRPADAAAANSKRKPLRVSKAPRSRAPSAAPVAAAPSAPQAKKDWRNKSKPAGGPTDGSRPRSVARPASADGAAPKRWRQDGPDGGRSAGRDFNRDGERRPREGFGDRSGGRDFNRDSGREADRGFKREQEGERRPWRGADEAPRARGERPARPEFGGERRPREGFGERSGGRDFNRDSGREADRGFKREQDGERRPWRGADEAPRARGERPARPEFGGERRPREGFGDRSGGRDFNRDSGREADRGFKREQDGERRPWRGADEAPRARGERPARPEFGGERRPREGFGDRSEGRDFNRNSERDGGRSFNRERDGYAAPRPAPTQPKPFKAPPTGGERPARMPREKVVPVRQAPLDAGVRVAKLMAERGLCSRREADVYIERGWVFVDGQRVTELGTRVQPSANISLDKQARASQARQMTVLLHKPVGFVSGQPEPGFRPAVSLIVPENQCCTPDTPLFHPACLKGLAPAGRLDIDSTGLLVLTQDGRIARQLIGDDSDVEKEYLVRVAGNLIENGLALLNHGLTLDGVELRPAQVEWLNDDQLRFVLKEGRKRQIRRMCELVGLRVVGLKRVRIGQIRLADLPPGQWRYLGEDEGF